MAQAAPSVTRSTRQLRSDEQEPESLCLSRSPCSYQRIQVHVGNIIIVSAVQVSFLPVGHTHEDVDAMFSRIARGLKYRNCNTIGDLMAICEGTSRDTDVREMRVHCRRCLLPKCSMCLIFGAGLLP